MTYAEDCAGISASCVAWEPLGWTCAWAATEIEKFPVAVLKERHPRVKLLGDMTKVNAQDHEPIDLLIGGTPCQGFSVAGFRAGLADPRSNLALAFLRHVDQARPRWVVWENVPGVYSSGDDFGSFLWGLSKLGYGYAYRTLDAQYFGVPQRRRRVFVIGYLGDWRPAAAVLFERESICKYSEKSKKVASDELTHTKCFAYWNERAGIIPTVISNTLRAKPSQSYYWQYPFLCVANNLVRKATPRECERLQGFPDDYTLITYRGKPATDGPRYKALGNSIPVPVLRWSGQRIKLVMDIQQTLGQP